MATYTLSPKYKKSAIEITYWTKDSVTIKRIEGYRSGTFYCESDTRPNISLKDNDELSVGFADCGTADCWEMDSLWDGCWGDWQFPDDMPPEEQARIEALYEEDSYAAIEEDGWDNIDTDYVFQGSLIMTCDGVELTDVETDKDESDDLPHVPSTAWPFPSAPPP